MQNFIVGLLVITLVCYIFRGSNNTTNLKQNSNQILLSANSTMNYTTSENKKPKVLIVMSNGAETIEYSAPYDILKRAGAEIFTAKVKDPTIIEKNKKTKNLYVITAQGLKIQTDGLLEEITKNKYDLIICPGGLPNAKYLGQSKELIKLLKQHKKEGKYISAICASPALVFEQNGILEGHQATCHPSFNNMLKNKEKINDKVVVSGNIITGKGPCAAVEFSYTLCELLFGKTKTDEIKKDMVY